MSPVKLALLWHMHQPSYRDPLEGSFVLPWVRLHALKDYAGMLEVLAETPGVHATFNLVPVLIDQLEAYASEKAEEPLWELCKRKAAELQEFERLSLLRALFQAHPRNLIARFPRYAELHERRGPKSDEAALRERLALFDTQDLLDLQVLARLAWCDVDWLRREPALQALLAKGRGYDEADKQSLLACERARLQDVVPAYRRALASGQVELTTSPYYHPILPLLCDTAAHHEAHPGAPLPRPYVHPEDAVDQIQRALKRHTAVFGEPPRGLWPSEGAVSEAVVSELARAGLRFTASDEGVLERSLGRALHRDSAGTAYPLELLYRPWVRATAHGDLALLFRDRALSDLIGFSYSGADPRVAAQDLLERLRRVGEQWRIQRLPGEALVTLILDGENAWEHYADGGRVFLRALYAGLQDDPRLRALTFSEALRGELPEALPRVFAGSWVQADFSVWIGHADDRRAWDALGQARDALQRSAGHVVPERLEQAWEAFRAACGSDWCWWYGEDHNSENDFEFDQLFRRHLQAVYQHLGLLVPEGLSETLISTRRAETRQSRPTGRVVPALDGELTSPEEWLGAGVYRVPAGGGTMHRGEPALRRIYFGSGDERLALMLETSLGGRDFLGAQQAAVSFPGPTAVRFRVLGGPDGYRVVREERKGHGWWVVLPTRARVGVQSVIEISIPLSELRPATDQRLEFRVEILQNGTELERHPQTAPLQLSLEEVSRD